MVEKGSSTHTNSSDQNQPEKRRRKGMLIPSNTDLHDCFVQVTSQIQT